MWFSHKLYERGYMVIKHKTIDTPKIVFNLHFFECLLFYLLLKYSMTTAIFCTWSCCEKTFSCVRQCFTFGGNEEILAGYVTKLTFIMNKNRLQIQFLHSNSKLKAQETYKKIW